MARSIFAGKSGQSGEVSINMTPMIDCTFLLIIFFILSSNFVKQSVVKLVLPSPYESQAISEQELKEKGFDPDAPNRAIVSIPSVLSEVKPEERDPDQALNADGYYVAGYDKVRVGDVEALAGILRELRDKARDYKEFFVEFRVDRDVQFVDVEPALMAAAKANIPDMHLKTLGSAKGTD